MDHHECPLHVRGEDIALIALKVRGLLHFAQPADNWRKEIQRIT